MQTPRLIREYERCQGKRISTGQAQALPQSPPWVTADDPSSTPNLRGHPSVISTLLACFAHHLTRPTSSPSSSCIASHTKNPTAYIRRSAAISPTNTHSPPLSPAKTPTAPATVEQCQPTDPPTRQTSPQPPPSPAFTKRTKKPHRASSAWSHQASAPSSSPTTPHPSPSAPHSKK